MKTNYEDLFNIYAVYLGYRSGTLVDDTDSNFDLIDTLQLHVKTNLILINHIGKRQIVLPCVTKKKLTRKENVVTEQQLGKILGYFCSAHTNWWDSNLPRIGIHIRFKIGNKHVVPFPMMCENTKLTKTQSTKLIEFLKDLESNYSKVAKYLKIDISNLKIVLTRYNIPEYKTNAKLSPAQFLKWKNKI